MRTCCHVPFPAGRGSYELSALISRCTPLEGEKRIAHKNSPTRLAKRTVDGEHGNGVLLSWLGFCGHHHALRHVKPLHSATLTVTDTIDPDLAIVVNAGFKEQPSTPDILPL